jgi:two-component system phosphate regulon response regulator PhoB
MGFEVTVLLADDDRVQTLMLSTRLKAKGFKVTVAYDAIQAWMAAIKTLPDVIVLDIQMPGGTGIAILKQLKTSTKTCQIPVIVLSGSIDPQIAISVKDLGADEFLPKPVDLDQLYRALSRLVGNTPEAPLQ